MGDDDLAVELDSRTVAELNSMGLLMPWNEKGSKYGTMATLAPSVTS